MSAALLIRLEPAQLAELKAAVVEQLAEPSPPPLLDRRGAAAFLGCGLDTLDKLRREGLPELRVGDAPRFEREALVAWLRGRP